MFSSLDCADQNVVQMCPSLTKFLPYTVDKSTYNVGEYNYDDDADVSDDVDNVDDDDDDCFDH